jgi:hypothetical protein
MWNGVGEFAFVFWTRKAESEEVEDVDLIG